MIDFNPLYDAANELVKLDGYILVGWSPTIGLIDGRWYVEIKHITHDTIIRTNHDYLEHAVIEAVDKLDGLGVYIAPYEHETH